MPAVQTQFGVTGFWASRETWVVIGFAIVAPLSCLSNLDALRYTSFFAIICVLFLTSVVLAYAIPSRYVVLKHKYSLNLCSAIDFLFSLNFIL